MNTTPAVTLTVPGAGHAVITCVPGADRADVRLTVTLPANENQAAQRLAALTTHVRALIGPPRAGHHPQGRAA